MNIDSTTVVKETVFIAIMFVTMRIGQWFTSTKPEWPLMLGILVVYLVIRIFFLKSKSPSP